MGFRFRQVGPRKVNTGRSLPRQCICLTSQIVHRGNVPSCSRDFDMLSQRRCLQQKVPRTHSVKGTWPAVLQGWSALMPMKWAWYLDRSWTVTRSETTEGAWTGRAPEKGLAPHSSSLQLLLHHLRFCVHVPSPVTLGPQWDRRHSRLCHCSTFSVTTSPGSPACCGHGCESLGAFVHNHKLRQGRCFQRTGSACGHRQGRRWGQSSPGGQESLALRRVCPTLRPRPHLRGGQCVFPLTLRMVRGESDRSQQS